MRDKFFLSTGALTAELTATDGKDILPLSGNFFQLGIAQRIDLLVKIPDQGGVFPLLAQGEGNQTAVWCHPGKRGRNCFQAAN
jgi:FtsP/CotA-like multicopper oxidase with cupredoxin domain